MPTRRSNSTVRYSIMPAFGWPATSARVWRSTTTNEIPAWRRRWASTSPAGPQPTIPTVIGPDRPGGSLTATPYDRSPSRRRSRSSPGDGREILVLHFPRVVHRVVRAVADEEWQVPRPHALALAGVVRPHGCHVRLAVLTQPLRRERTTLRHPQPQPLRELLALGTDGVADDLVAVAPTATRSLPHLRRHPRRHRVEERPARAQQPELAVELRVVHRFALQARRRERDAPEVGRARAHPVLDDVEPSGGVELVGPPSRDRDRPIPLAIRLERLQRRLRALRPAAPPRPVDRERHRLLPLAPTLHDSANGHRGRMVRGAYDGSSIGRQVVLDRDQRAPPRHSLFVLQYCRVEIHPAARRHGIADGDILHAIEHALVVDDLGEEPDRWLVIGPDH